LRPQPKSCVLMALFNILMTKPTFQLSFLTVERMITLKTHTEASSIEQLRNSLSKLTELF